jgi:hypothetical protein
MAVHPFTSLLRAGAEALDESTLERLTAELSAPMRVGVAGRLGSGRDTVRRALCGAGAVVAEPGEPADIDVYLCVETLTREDIDALVAAPRPAVAVLNKADLLPEGHLSGMAVSALNGDGLEALLAAVDGRLGAGEQESLHRIDAGDGARSAWLHRHAEVLETTAEDDVLVLRVRMSATAHARFAQLPRMDEAGPISANDP